MSCFLQFEFDIPRCRCFGVYSNVTWTSWMSVLVSIIKFWYCFIIITSNSHLSSALSSFPGILAMNVSCLCKLLTILGLLWSFFAILFFPVWHFSWGVFYWSVLQHTHSWLFQCADELHKSICHFYYISTAASALEFFFHIPLLSGVLNQLFLPKVNVLTRIWRIWINFLCDQLKSALYRESSSVAYYVSQTVGFIILFYFVLFCSLMKIWIGCSSW